jgi:hypothetical protein
MAGVRMRLGRGASNCHSIGALLAAPAVLLFTGFMAFGDSPWQYNGATHLVSVNRYDPGDPNYGSGNGASELISTRPVQALSDNGRYIVFISAASDLVAGDTNGVADLFVRDRDPNNACYYRITGENICDPVISANGRYVAYSRLTGTPPDTRTEVHRYDLNTSTEVCVTCDLPDEFYDFPAEGRSQPTISSDGSIIAFTVVFGNKPPPGKVTRVPTVMLYDFVADEYRLVARCPHGDCGDAENYGDTGAGEGRWPVVSGDGLFVAYFGDSLDLCDPNESCASCDTVLLYDDDNVENEVICVSTGGEPREGALGQYDVSYDGTYVVFASQENDLTEDDLQTSTYNIFVRERDPNSPTTLLLSRSCDDPNDIEPDGNSYRPSVSDDGRFVAFESYASDLACDPNDTNGAVDAFVIDRDVDEDEVFDEPNEVITRILSRKNNGDQVSDHSYIRSCVSGDGCSVVFDSQSAELHPDDDDVIRDVFIRIECHSQRACIGDVDEDGDTDMSDLALLLGAYGSHCGDEDYDAAADLDCDCDVDLTDQATLLADYACGT